MHDVDLLSEILRRACSTAAVPPVSVLQLLRTVRAGELAGLWRRQGRGADTCLQCLLLKTGRDILLSGTFLLHREKPAPFVKKISVPCSEGRNLP